MQFVRPHHDLQCPVSIVLIDIRIVDHIDTSALLCFFHKLICHGKHHGLHGTALFGYHRHADRIVVSSDGTHASDAEILLGKLRLFVSLAEGFQALQFIDQCFRYRSRFSG